MSLNTSKPATPVEAMLPYTERTGRKVPVASTKTALMTAAMVPVWAVTVLPLSVLYQAARAIAKPLIPKPTFPPLDSGYRVDDPSSTIVPRANRKYDVVVLGATGFTGRLAARYLAQTYAKNGAGVKWALAGRSQEKLDKVKQSLAEELNNPDLLTVDTLIVDTSVPSTLPALMQSTRVVATTAGPYTLFGSPVVEFCAKFGTHYVDITGEVDWVKTMVLQWQDTAAATGAKLVSFCGHDSIPWDLSVMKLQEILKKECQDDLQTVTFWDENTGGAPGGTYATVMANAEGKAMGAPESDFDPFLRLPDGTKSSFVMKPDLPTFIAQSQSPWEKDRDTPRYTMPFVMASVNAKVARWSHALRQTGSRSIIYRESMVCADWKTAFVSYTGLLMFGSVLMNPLTREIVKKYVIPQSGEGPSMKTMETKSYLCVSGEAIGTNGNRAESVMFFPKDAGCLETSRMLIESSLCLALQEKELPEVSGGFWTPSTALGDVLFDRLVATGTHFESRVVEPVRSKL